MIFFFFFLIEKPRKKGQNRNLLQRLYTLIDVLIYTCDFHGVCDINAGRACVRGRDSYRIYVGITGNIGGDSGGGGSA